VTDSGIGIDPELLEKIFQPFEQGSVTGDHLFGGLGLGLAIARAIVELHGGRSLALAATQEFDLVISDLGLPDGTGIQLMQTLRSRHGLRGIALTGYGMEDDIARAREAGFISHLIKPVQFSELRTVLSSLAGSGE